MMVSFVLFDRIYLVVFKSCFDLLILIVLLCCRCYCFVLYVPPGKGLQRWQDARDVWCGNSSGNSQSSTSASLPRSAINIDVDEIIDILFDPRWRGGGIVPTAPPAAAAAAASIATTRTDSGTLSPSSSDFGESSGALPPILSPQQQLHQDHLPPRFPSNVPLPQMIDVLVDLWEAEGLDI